MNWKKQTCGLDSSVTQTESLRFLSVRLHSIMSDHGGKPEERHQLAEAINEVTFGIRNELGCIQCQNSMPQHVAACIA